MTVSKVRVCCSALVWVTEWAVPLVSWTLSMSLRGRQNLCSTFFVRNILLFQPSSPETFCSTPDHATFSSSVFHSLDGKAIIRAAPQALPALLVWVWPRGVSGVLASDKGQSLFVTPSPAGFAPSALCACRLIPLDKSPGVRPIWVLEVCRRVISKALIKTVCQMGYLGGVVGA